MKDILDRPDAAQHRSESAADGQDFDGTNGIAFDDLAPLVSSIETVEVGRIVEKRWHGSYRALLGFSDLTAIFAALLLSVLFRFKITGTPLAATSATVLAVLIALVWLASLVMCEAYEVRRLSTGPQEWRRLARAGGFAAAVVVAGCYFTRQDVARGFLAIVFPIGIVLLAIGRLNVRRIVRSRRLQQDWHHRVLAVGSVSSVEHLIENAAKAQHAQVRIVGACVEDTEVGAVMAGGVPVVGNVDMVSEQAASLGVDVVALAGGSLSPTRIRELSWELEGSGRGLVMAHAMADIAAPRLQLSPLDGIPMVWVNQPQFSGPTQRLKRVFDIVAASFGVVVFLPLLALIALAVKVTSPGPTFFRQSRLGLDGREFNVLKFRTMVDGAEAMRAELIATNQLDGALFKMKSDPRITKLGAVLRRTSLDELPQLWNVLRGDMSLVGPRPLATQDSDYEGPARRRLLVRPGITGLWQVSGRSDVTWEDAVKLDLYYVENWSLGLDLSLIAKTVVAVLMRRGAY